MKKEKFDIKVKQIIEQYKKNLAILMRKGHACEVVALLNDSGTLFTKDKYPFFALILVTRIRKLLI